MNSRQYQISDQEFRKRQIDTLKIFNADVTERIENEEYSVKFYSGGRAFHLIIHLSPNFPNEKPKIFISPIVQHNWIDTRTGEIENAPGLLNYTRHSDLGRVVEAICREFERFPPILAEEESPCDGKSISEKSSADVTKTNPAFNKITNSFKTNYDNTLPDLSNFSLDELKLLDTDPDFFDDFIEEMSVVQHLNEDLDSMINQVEIIARENLSKESKIKELKQKLNDDVVALKSVGEKCDKLNRKYLEKAEEYAPQHIRELLQIAVSDADTDCEKHIEHFLSGKIDVQTFLNNYKYAKKLSSERKAKEERLGQQLTALERNSM